MKDWFRREEGGEEMVEGLTGMRRLVIETLQIRDSGLGGTYHLARLKKPGLRGWR